MSNCNAEAAIISGELKHDERGRVIISDQRWNEILREYDQSWLTQRKFCQSNGINYNTFVARLGARKLGKADTERKVPVNGFVEAKFTSSSVVPIDDKMLEVVLPCGTLLRGKDANGLAALLKALRGEN
jgi:hypothetical protein